MDALFAKQKQRFRVEEDAEQADDELDLEASANRFTEALRQGKPAGSTPKTATEKPISDRKQDVYLDKTTGKIVVNPRKSDHTTGVKRALNRRDNDVDANDDAEVRLQARSETQRSWRVDGSPCAEENQTRSPKVRDCALRSRIRSKLRES